MWRDDGHDEFEFDFAAEAANVVAAFERFSPNRRSGFCAFRVPTNDPPEPCYYCCCYCYCCYSFGSPHDLHAPPQKSHAHHCCSAAGDDPSW